MYTTPMRRTPDGTYVRATFGLYKIGTQEPYMSLTGEEYRSSHPTERDMLSCGQLHNLVCAVFPELAPLRIWHMCTDGIPMHYLANARFWWEAHNHVRPMSSYDPNPEKAFASTVALGALPTDPSGLGLLDRAWPEVESMLKARIPAMQAAYRAVVDTLPELTVKLGAE